MCRVLKEVSKGALKHRFVALREFKQLSSRLPHECFRVISKDFKTFPSKKDYSNTAVETSAS